jgi:hypothetical protein
VRFDDDLLTNSNIPMETLLKMGMRVGVAVPPPRK